MVGGEWVPVRTAWEHALYGDRGFYRTNLPAEHFRTSPQVSAAFADAVVAIVRRHALASVCDLGAGGGELLAEIHRVAPDLLLTGVDVRDRPQVLPDTIGWQRESPSGFGGLVFANELLDNVPCDVVEVDDEGSPRYVEVDVATGEERVGAEVDGESVEWLTRWWPISDPGQRAEVGMSRDAFWATVCTANPNSVCIAVDYGHVSQSRPTQGSLASYRKGIQTPVAYDARHDITAHVAFDSLAAAVGGVVWRQRDVLRDVGLSGRRPPIGRATHDPRGYLRELAKVSRVAEVGASGGLGDFCWLFRSLAHDAPTC